MHNFTMHCILLLGCFDPMFFTIHTFPPPPPHAHTITCKVSMHLFQVRGLISGRWPETDKNSIIGQFEIGNLRGYGAEMNDE